MVGRTLWKSTHLKGSSVCMFLYEIVRTYLNNFDLILLFFLLFTHNKQKTMNHVGVWHNCQKVKSDNTGHVDALNF